MEIKSEPKIPDVNIKSLDSQNIKYETQKRKSMFLRTCLKCGKNCYSAGEYSEHMKSGHNKVVSTSDVSEPRTVRPTMANTGQEVPEEILVKPRKVEESKAEVANSRKIRKATEETPTQEQKQEISTASETPKDEPKTEVKKPRGRRKKATDK